MKYVAVIAGLWIFWAPSALSDQRYENPVDGQSYSTDGEFRTYSPEQPRGNKGQKVTTDQVLLLTGETDIKERVSVEDLAAFIEVAEVEIHAILSRVGKSARVLVQFECLPAGHTVKLASQGEVKDALLQELYDSLKALPPLKVKGEVHFQLGFTARP